MLILWPLLISCGPEPLPAASPTLPASTLHTQGAGVPLRLTELLDGASLTLPERTVPKDAALLGAMPHWWLSWLHSVRASGPSIASTTSNSETSTAGRVSR